MIPGELLVDDGEIELNAGRSHESAIVLKIAKSSLLVAAPGTRQPDT